MRMLLYKLIILVVVFVFTSAHAPDECNERCDWCEDGRCKECRYGFYGHNCNSRCQNCWISGCHKHTGKCEQCQPGRWGENCQHNCPSNCRDVGGETHCARDTGKCQDGCKEGFFEGRCDDTCRETCASGTCLQDNGHCIGDCKAGWRGLRCDERCSEGCFNSSCECLTGKCVHGCKHGFDEDDATCRRPKHDNCLNSQYRIDSMSLICTHGCKLGWTSASCLNQCSSGCIRCHQTTSDCELRCSRHCKDGKCNGVDRCLDCKDGRWGDTCNKHCPQNCKTCRQDDRSCKTCNEGWAGHDCEEKIKVEYGEYKTSEDQTNSGGSKLILYHIWTTLVIVFLISCLGKSC